MHSPTSETTRLEDEAVGTSAAVGATIGVVVRVSVPAPPGSQYNFFAWGFDVDFRHEADVSTFFLSLLMVNCQT